MTPTVWDLLQADHDMIWDLLNRLTGGPDARATDPNEQRQLAKRLVALQSAHEFAEEQVIMPAVRRHCPDGAALADEVLAQEKLVKRALNELMAFAPATSEFDECVNAIAGENRNHLSYEQNQVWPRLRDALSDEQVSDLAHAWSRARRRAPTRPHPHLPPHPDLLARLGPVLAARDRAVDAARRMSPPHPAARHAASDGARKSSTRASATTPSVP